MEDRPVDVADPSSVRSNDDLARCLKILCRSRGLTYSKITKAAKEFRGKTPDVVDLPKATLSAILSGKRAARREQLLTMLLTAGLRSGELVPWFAAWERCVAQGLALRSGARVSEISPQDFGVQAAIHPHGLHDVLPTYIDRDQDADIERALTIQEVPATFVLVLGEPATGKTRFAYEAVLKIAPHAQAIIPSSTTEIVALAAAPPEGALLWLDDLHRFFGADPPLDAGTVGKLVRSGVMIVATMWREKYNARMTLGGATGIDLFYEDRRLLRCARTIIDLRPDFLEAERKRAMEKAEGDPAIRAALAVSDVGFIQCLAGAPHLVRRFEYPTDLYAKAIIDTAADGRRLGASAPFSPELLACGAESRLSRTLRGRPRSEWWEPAVANATEVILGAVSVLAPIGENFVVADYLTLHVARTRRTVRVPDETWIALVDHVFDPADLRQLAQSAIARMRYRYALLLLRKSLSAGDRDAVPMLVELLVTSQQIDAAVEIVENAITGGDDRLTGLLRDLLALQGKVSGLADAAARGDEAALADIDDLITDGGRIEVLRMRAAAGDTIAEDQLDEALAARSDIVGLTQRVGLGDRFAAERRSEILARQNRVDELAALAAEGDAAAEWRLVLLLAAQGDEEKLRKLAKEGNAIAERLLSAGQEELAALQQNSVTDRVGHVGHLRQQTIEGNRLAAEELTTALFDLRDEAGLLDEVDAGTPGARHKYVALLASQGRHSTEDIRRLRRYGLGADGAVCRREDVLWR